MFTVRPHPPKGPSSAPFSSPGGAVVAFGGRFPALLLLLGLVFVFLPVYFCVRFSWVFALPAYRPWSFIFLPSLGSVFSGGRLRRLILLAPSPVLFPVVSASRGSFFFGPVFLPGLPCLGPVSLCVRLGASFCSWSFSVFPLCFPGRLSSLRLLFLLVLLLSLSPLRFCSLLLGTSFFVLDFLISCRSISLYFFIYFYLFRFVRLKNCGKGG